MSYSAVTQPFPEASRHLGTSSSTQAVQRTRVLPLSIMTEPGTPRRTFRWMWIGRSWLGRRPSGRFMRPSDRLRVERSKLAGEKSGVASREGQQAGDERGDVGRGDGGTVIKV